MKSLFIIPLFLASCALPHGIVQDKIYKEPAMELALVSVPSANIFNPYHQFQTGYIIAPEKHFLKIAGKRVKVTKAQYEQATIGGVYP